MQAVATFLCGGVLCTALLISLLFTRLWPLVMIYAVWYIYDRDTPHSGGRRLQAMRNSKLWTYFRDFFPLKLVKTCDLDPNKNYLFACHPHGVLCVSHFGNFATEDTGFSKLFPGIDPHLFVLDGHFQFPLYRDYIMGYGIVMIYYSCICGCNKNSLEYILKSKGQGNAACIAVGGALEALEAHPTHFTLNLAYKKGFIKNAIRTGAFIVPVFSFGENEVYTQVRNPVGSRVRRLQMFLTTYLGFSPPLFHGRGVFNYTFGLLPYRRPITTVVGEPLEVKQNSDPSNEEINELHIKYVLALQNLFEANKKEFGVSEFHHLKFI
ncbi:MOGAT2 [Bugula neritina]|uniref:Acyltransferase n=1 Tax=Bugula neritina TaxID=10212 RepID=A0A7J7JLX6_BUGNE|nr:MOGAT2 [Bugula neritina]